MLRVAYTLVTMLAVAAIASAETYFVPGPGETVLLQEDFDGGTLPAPWAFGTNSSGGSSVLHDGQLDLVGGTTDGGGAWIETPELFTPTPGTILDLRVRAKLNRGSANASIAFAKFAPLDDRGTVSFTWLALSDKIVATSARPFDPHIVPIDGVDPSAWHDFRIVHSGNAVDYFVDGVRVARISERVPSGHAMRLRLDQSSTGVSSTSEYSSVLVTSRPAPAGHLACLPDPDEVELFRDEFTGAALSGDRWSRTDATLEAGVLQISSGSPTSIGITPGSTSAITMRCKARASGPATGSDNIEFLECLMLDEGVAFTLYPGTYELWAVVGHPDGLDHVTLSSVDATKWHDYGIVRVEGRAYFYVDGELVADLPTRKSLTEPFKLRVQGSTTGRTVNCEYIGASATLPAGAGDWTTLLDQNFNGSGLSSIWAFSTNSSGGSHSLAGGNLAVIGGTTDGGGARVETTGKYLVSPDLPLRLGVRARMSSIDAQFFLGFANDSTPGSAFFVYDQFSRKLSFGTGAHWHVDQEFLPEIDSSVWHEYVIEFSGAVATFFVDGAPVGSHTGLDLAGTELAIRLDQISVGTERTSEVDCLLLTRGSPMTPTNRAPAANAGTDQVVEATTVSATGVVMSGSGSSDPDGDVLSYAWSGDFGTATGVAPTLALALGVHTITLTVTDTHGASAMDTVIITVQDTTAPVFTTVSADPAVLCPPNHKMVAVTLSGTATDSCDAHPSLAIASVTSNEPTEGLGDGDTPVDWVVTGAMTLNLRAERSGKGSGRIYTITVRATDASGNSSLKAVMVTVPKDCADTDEEKRDDKESKKVGEQGGNKDR